MAVYFAVHVRLGGKVITNWRPGVLTVTVVLQGALTLLNVETGLDGVSELEAIGAFIVILLLTQDLNKDKNKK